MDAAAQLALMAKAKLVFEAPGTFLSFPAFSPLSFRSADLAFGRALKDPSVGTALADFSRAVSRCPTQPIFRVDREDYLWDRYDTWLSAMILAESDLPSDDQSVYAAARELLIVTDANGLDGDSPIVVTYKQYRNAVINAQQAYKAAEITATNSGQAALTAWNAGDEPRLRAAAAAAEAAWETAGRRSDVEQARATVARCEALMPRKIWADWRKAYTPGIDKVTDATSNTSYAPSGFAPAGLTGEDWTTLHLTGAEIASLSATAPKALRDIFGDTGNSIIAKISFEFRSASIIQDWFNPDMFGKRFWKFGDSTVLSDGSSPPSGDWPACVVAVVFVRNVQVTLLGTTQTPQPLQELPRLALASGVLPHSLTTVFELPGPWAASGRPGPKISRSGNALTVDMSAYGRPPAHGSVIDAQTVSVTFSDDAIFTGRLLPPGTIAWSNRTTWTKVSTPTPPSPDPTSITATAQVVPPADKSDDRISILAFICRPLPKSPDPDLSLHW